jgi:hypothetical protein
MSDLPFVILHLNLFVELYHDANEVLLTISRREVKRQQVPIAFMPPSIYSFRA